MNKIKYSKLLEEAKQLHPKYSTEQLENWAKYSYKHIRRKTWKMFFKPLFLWRVVILVFLFLLVIAAWLPKLM